MRFDHVAQQVPDIAEAVEWQRATVPGTTVLYQDATWALVDSAGVRIAFVLPEQHPNHLAFRVDDAELERLAAEHGAEIATHRDATRSIYLRGPGTVATEIISYPPGR
ncbi:VOC family protein [Miltoncostaea marina]|uniref:VOC family protein n=1 Tax=Miltoncostaea marina TaxID=2843215 RepID=UPI001C3CAEA7|nr:VOC family protein [Miltoncostaea marina]